MGTRESEYDMMRMGIRESVCVLVAMRESECVLVGMRESELVRERERKR